MNEQLKPYKTVEQIAKKHRMDVSFIQKQLDMGEPIEHEHTKNHELAKEIALQHLDEIPDYYTRLKKMEASAKKEHKKFKDVKINEEGLRAWFGKSKSKEGKPGWVNVVTGGTCASDEPGEGTPKCVSSAKRASMNKAERLSAARRKKAADPGQQEKSGAAKPTYVSTDPKKKMKEEMDLQEVKDKPGKGSGKKDACYNKVKSRYDVWPSAYASGALVKCRKVGADNWGTKSEACWDGYEAKGMKKKGKKMGPNCVPVKEETGMIRYCPKCDKCETRAECKYGPKYWDMFSLPAPLSPNQKKYNIATVHPGNFPESYDHEHSMARSEISTIISAAKRLRRKMKGEGNVEAWVQSKITKAADYLDSAADYVDSGEMKAEQNNLDEIAPALVVGGIAAAAAAPYLMKKFVKPAVDKALDGERKTSRIGGERYDNAIQQLRKESKTFSQFMEDWQSVNRKDKTDGLSPAAVKAYRSENPGSKLQTAVTEKNPTGKRASRRKSFCSRMSGMKSKLTSSKTARDPDSRINKALRRWNCN